MRSFEKKLFFVENYLIRIKTMMLTWTLNNYCLNWLGIRLQLLGIGIFFCVAFTITVILFMGIDIEYANLGLAVTYSIIVSNSFADMIHFFSGSENRMISVERIS